MSQINAALVIPSLNPDKKIMQVIQQTVDQGFSTILVVDDGSDTAHKQIFQTLCQTYPQITLLTHPKNLGKGEGLKTAFRYYLEHFADKLGGVVTADGDGQHLAKDIAACAQEMLQSGEVIFGCRDFSLPEVPPKSRFGNHTTSLVFKIACGMNISDTQTGLRAIPNQYLPAILEMEGSRFEYETNMILGMKQQNIPLREVKIETVYEDNNNGTHFHPIKDSVRIYKWILRYILKYHQGIKYVISSGVCFILDYLIHYTVLKLLSLTNPTDGVLLFLANHHIFTAYLTGRLISSMLNFTLNRRYVFRSTEPLGKSIAKYYALCIPQAAIGMLGEKLLAHLLEVSAPSLLTVLKLLVDICLFFLSYFIQRIWVFRKKETDKKES